LRLHCETQVTICFTVNTKLTFLQFTAFYILDNRIAETTRKMRLCET